MKDKSYLFYKCKNLRMNINIPDIFKAEYFIPSIKTLKLHKGSRLIYTFWYLTSFGNYKILYIRDKQTDEIAHYSNILPKIFIKFPFMKQTDLHIVKCFTSYKFRGNSLYPFALQKIASDFPKQVKWVITNSNNIASKKGIEKAGYSFVGKGIKATKLGIYKLLKR